MRLELINGLQTLIIAFISYVVTITFAGWFEALIAKKAGDDTAEQAGFLTLDPLEHFNVFGFAAVLWGEFFVDILPIHIIPGWGRHIPLVPDMIRSKYNKLFVFIEYIGRSCGHFILLMTSGTMLISLFQYIQMFGLQGRLPSYVFVFQQVLTFIFKQNLILFIIHFILGLFKTLVYFYIPRYQEIGFKMIFVGFLVLTFGLFLLGPILQYFVENLLGLIETIISTITRR